MPGETQRDRDLRALEEAQAKPCAFCLEAPRAPGDHYCRACRRRVEQTRRDYEAAVKRTETEPC